MNQEVLKAIQFHKISKDFWSYYHEANSSSVLTEKEELLVRLAASLSSGCIP